MLNKTKMIEAKEVNTPMASSTSLPVHDGSRVTDVTNYRKVVGNIQYRSLTHMTKYCILHQ